MRLCLLIWIVMIASPAFAAKGFEVPDPGRGFARDRYAQNFECMGAFGGQVSLGETDGHLAILAQGCVMHIWDCSVPGRPRELSWVKFPSYINTIAIRQPAVYVATSYKTVQVLDITDPSQPKYLSDLEAGGGSGDLSADVIGNMLYVAEEGKYGQSNYIYNVSSPLKPRLIRGLSRRKTYLYACNGLKFFVFGGLEDADNNLLEIDLENPDREPRNLGKFPFPEDDTSYAFAVRSGRLVFNSRQTSKTLTLLSPEESKKLLIDGEFYLEPHASAHNSVREDDLNHIIALQNSFNFSWVKVADGRACLIGENDYVTLLDVHDPAEPALIARYRGSAKPIAFAIEGDRIYFSDTSSTLMCLATSGATTPTLVSKIELPAPATQMVSRGNMLMVAAADGLRIYDYAAPQAPKLASTFKTDEKCGDLITSGSQVILAAGGKVKFIDVSTTHAQLLREVSVFSDGDEDHECRLKRRGNFVYFIKMNLFMGVDCEAVVLDLNRPDAEPAPLKSPDEAWEDDITTPTSSQIWTLGLPVSYSQTSGGQSGMNLFDLTNPVAPHLVGGYWRLSRYPVHKPVLFKRHIFIADGGNGLLVLRPVGAGKKQ